MTRTSFKESSTGTVRRLSEVSRSVDWAGGEVRYWLKKRIDRGSAWKLIKPVGTTRNPWRKAHSENYWIWVGVDQDLMRLVPNLQAVVALVNTHSCPGF